ncbi:MAG: hypothetical protein Ct9H300mP1_15580 [Planctomycetaceae bacterium]|nr:MAG: hypothetical protein Ct9H300mP1_15580 [Planctomycetaceae bacterium]
MPSGPSTAGSRLSCSIPFPLSSGEDTDGDGQLGPGEDTNGNGQFGPGNRSSGGGPVAGGRFAVLHDSQWASSIFPGFFHAIKVTAGKYDNDEEKGKCLTSRR